jgi:5'-deoxynucleotidase YfbR-like HD superfamily hydrolase
MVFRVLLFSLSLLTAIPALAIEEIVSPVYSADKTCVGPLGITNAIDVLKAKHRRGWVIRGVEKLIETVWDHSLKTSKAAGIFFARRYPELRTHAVFMALYHDLPEYRAPDLTPSDHVEKNVKEAAERAALNDLFPAPRTPQQEKIIKVWEEYAEGFTSTAFLVRELNKADAAVQAMVYHLRGEKTYSLLLENLAEMKDHELYGILRLLKERLDFGLLKDPYAEYFALLARGVELQ